MSNYSNKKSRKKLNFAKIFGIGIFVYFISVFCVQQFRINEYKVQEEYYENAIADIKEEKIENEELMAETNTAEYIEQVAREKLGLVKPYEKIFMDINK